MDVQQLRDLFNGLIYEKNAFAHINQFRLRSLSLKSALQLPQAIPDSGSYLFGLFPGSGLITGSRKEVQDNKMLRCMSFEEVHECHREPGIINGYRHENCSVMQAILSLFRATNETVNFWTHFIPTLYFLWLFFSLATSMPLFSDPYLFPFVCYMATSCAYPFMSCLAHAFSCLSHNATHICFFLDYTTLSLYAWGAAILYYSYSFPHTLFNSFYASIFLPISSVMTVLSTFMACSSRFTSSTSSKKLLRLGAFVIPYIWDSAPLIWRLIHCDFFNDSCSYSGAHHIRQFVGVSLAAFFYGSHIPERLAPGRFDFVGNSHNLLHLFGIAATYEQLNGALIDINGRRTTFEELQWTTASSWVTIITPSIVLINVFLVVLFSSKLNKLDKHPNFTKTKDK